MPVGKGIALAGLAGLALLAFAGSSSASSGGGSTTGSGDECIDDSMPADMKAKVRELLRLETITPTDLEAAALAAETGGFPKAAACLRKKAQQKRASAELEVAAKGGMPFQIRYGDIPFRLAQYYTGDGARFKELGPLNPQIGQLRTVNGVTNYEGWRPGLNILIPSAWNPLAKPVPAPLGGGGGGAKPPAPAPGPTSPPAEDIEVNPGWSDVVEDIVDTIWGPYPDGSQSEDPIYSDPSIPPLEPGT